MKGKKKIIVSTNQSQTNQLLSKELNENNEQNILPPR